MPRPWELPDAWEVRCHPSVPRGWGSLEESWCMTITITTSPASTSEGRGTEIEVAVAVAVRVATSTGAVRVHAWLPATPVGGSRVSAA